MQYYFAPLEGITGYVYRTTHHAFFPGVDRYYIPFAAPNYTKHFKNKEKQDMDPANNAGLHAVPQILSNNADETLWAIEEMADRGYEEINLNLGCPMPTVAKKKKGSGLLKYTDELDAYLSGVFEGLSRRDASRPDVKISIKTRLGTDTTEEAEELSASITATRSASSSSIRAPRKTCTGAKQTAKPSFWSFARARIRSSTTEIFRLRRMWRKSRKSALVRGGTWTV